MDIKELTDPEIIELCNNIYDWDTGDGTLNKDSDLRKLFNEHEKEYYAIHYLRDDILHEAFERFYKVARVLIRNKPTLFIK